MRSVEFADNGAQVMAALERAKRRALEGVGERAEGYAKALAPVDTGALRRGIGHAAEGDVLTVGSDAAYAPYVELGAGRTKPQPFLRPAMEAHRGEYMKIVTEAMRGGNEGMKQ